MKSIFYALLIAIIATLGWRACAQTNIAPTISTNWITAGESFREVNGKLYNTERSILWRFFNGKCLQILTNGILVQTYTNEPIFETGSTSMAHHNVYGDVNGYTTIPTTVQVGTKEVPEMKFILLNYPTNPNPTVFLNIPFRALRIGTTDFNGDKVELWDYGTPHVVRVVTTNYPRADIGLKFNLDAADKGDAYGLLRMGERYRDGDGVPKDLAKAKDYLTKAAAAGSPTADADLKICPQTKNPSPHE